MKKIINYGCHYIDNADILAVVKALKQTKITQGKNVELFEQKLKSFFNSKYSSVVSNGTAALHLTMLSLNLSHNDKIITSPISFLASANCVEYVGAKVDFCDIDQNTYTIDPNHLEDKLKKDKKIKAVIVVDYAGHPADWASFLYLKRKYNISLINDNCHALGSKINNDPSYALKYADIVTQSFHPVKNITTGEGGAVITNNSLIASKIALLRNHGMTKRNDNPWQYSMGQLGYNYRLPDINCALGISQLSKLNIFINKRRKVASIYNKNLLIECIKLPEEKKNIFHSYHLYPIQINFKILNIDKKTFFKKMLKQNINLQVHYIPIHLQNYYRRKYGFKKGDFTIAENFYKNEVSLPIYFTLTEKEQYRVINLIKQFLE
jgi:UDP-4-amino-4,6-dideoxy-N-acetyl-beta-L-altrosamine transaminase